MCVCVCVIVFLLWVLGRCFKGPQPKLSEKQG